MGPDQTTAINTALALSTVQTLSFSSTSLSSYMVNGTVTVPAGKVLKFEAGNKLTGTGTVSGGIIDANEHIQVFDTTLTVTNIKGAQGFISVKWFGAVGTYSGSGAGTDDEPAFRKSFALLAANIGTSNLIIKVPRGDYYIKNELLPPNSASWFTIQGEGMNVSKIYWGRTASGGDMLRLTNAQRVAVKDLSFVGQTNGGVPSTIINVYRSEPKSGSVGNISDCLFENVAAHGNLGAYKRGLVFSCAGANNSSSDGNNEQSTIRNCYFEIADSFGISFEHQNSLWHRIIGGRIDGYVAGINNVRSNGSSGGNFSVEGTVVMNLNSGNSLCFNLTGAQYPIIISKVNSEGGSYILKARASTEGLEPNIIMNDCGFKVTSASYAIDVSGNNNSLVLNNCSISGNSGSSIKSDSAGASLTLNSTGGVNAITYNGVVSINGSNSSASTTFTNLGSGQLKIADNAATYTTNSSNSATPSVEGKNYIEFQYSSPTTITGFTGGYIGQKVWVFIGTASAVTLSTSGFYTLSGANNLLTQNKTYEFLKTSASFGGKWAMVGESTASLSTFAPINNPTFTGNVGIGISPSVKLQVSNASSGYNPVFKIENTGNSGDDNKNVALFKGNWGSNTTIKSNTNVGIQQADATVGNYTGLVFFNASFSESAMISIKNNNHSAGTPSGDINFLTANSGAVATRLTIKASGILNLSNTPNYTDNAAAIAGGLAVGDVYRNGDVVMIVH